MNIFLYVEVLSEVPYTYQNAKAEKLKSRFPEIIVYDCDNHSESFIVQAAVNLLDTSHKAIVWIEAWGGELGKIRLVMERIIQHAGRIRVVYKGFQVTLDQLLQALPTDSVVRNPTEEEFWQLATDWYGTEQ